MNIEVKIFIEKNVGSIKRIEKLAGDASNREYYRIFCDNKTYVLCSDHQFKNAKEGEYPFLIVHELFKKASVPVPEIYDADSQNGLFLLQDLGDDLLEKIYEKLSNTEKQCFYKELIHLLVIIQSIKKENSKNIIPFTLSFDVEKLMYEFNFFIEHTLTGYFASNMSTGEIEELRNEFFKISVLLDRPDFFVLNHRDYHSRNVIIMSHPYIIDFQDARMGLPQYDLVSFLRDSYVQLDEDTLNLLIDFYFKESVANGIHKMNRDEFEYYFDIMAFQRNVKALGTFGYQTKLKKTTYINYIKPTYDYLAAYSRKRKELINAYNILNKYIGNI